MITTLNLTPNSFFLDKYFYGDSTLSSFLAIVFKGNLLLGTLVCENKS